LHFHKRNFQSKPKVASFKITVGRNKLSGYCNFDKYLYSGGERCIIVRIGGSYTLRLFFPEQWADSTVQKRMTFHLSSQKRTPTAETHVASQITCRATHSAFLPNCRKETGLNYSRTMTDFDFRPRSTRYSKYVNIIFSAFSLLSCIKVSFSQRAVSKKTEIIAVCVRLYVCVCVCVCVCA